MPFTLNISWTFFFTPYFRGFTPGIREFISIVFQFRIFIINIV